MTALKIRTEVKSLELICYGLGNQYDSKKFEPIKNNKDRPKPAGGLWTSPINSQFGWKDWIQINEWRTEKLETSFIINFTGSVYTVNSYSDLLDLPWLNKDYNIIDFEKLMEECDAFHLTVEGEHETRYTQPTLYGWDLETVFIMNKECIRNQP